VVPPYVRTINQPAANLGGLSGNIYVNEKTNKGNGEGGGGLMDSRGGQALEGSTRDT